MRAYHGAVASGEAISAFHVVLILFSVVPALLSGYSAALMLYAWEDEENLSRNSVPETYEPRLWPL